MRTLNLALVITLGIACISEPSAPAKTFANWYTGAWELVTIRDSVVMDGPLLDRPPTADEARTWHVFDGEMLGEDSAQVPVTVQWESGRSGVGKWYVSGSLADIIQPEISLSDTTGLSEHYTRQFGAVMIVGETDTTLSLGDLSVGSREYAEFYRKVGPP